MRAQAEAIILLIIESQKWHPFCFIYYSLETKPKGDYLGINTRWCGSLEAILQAAYHRVYVLVVDMFLFHFTYFHWALWSLERSQFLNTARKPVTGKWKSKEHKLAAKYLVLSSTIRSLGTGHYSHLPSGDRLWLWATPRECWFPSCSSCPRLHQRVCAGLVAPPRG